MTTIIKLIRGLSIDEIARMRMKCCEGSESVLFNFKSDDEALRVLREYFVYLYARR